MAALKNPFNISAPSSAESSTGGSFSSKYGDIFLDGSGSGLFAGKWGWIGLAAIGVAIVIYFIKRKK